MPDYAVTMPEPSGTRVRRDSNPPPHFEWDGSGSRDQTTDAKNPHNYEEFWASAIARLPMSRLRLR
jgi:hypothetical protein